MYWLTSDASIYRTFAAVWPEREELHSGALLQTCVHHLNVRTNYIIYIRFYLYCQLSPVYESNGVTGEIVLLLYIAWSVNFLRRTVDGSNGDRYCLTTVTHTVTLHNRWPNNRRFKFNIEY